MSFLSDEKHITLTINRTEGHAFQHGLRRREVNEIQMRICRLFTCRRVLFLAKQVEGVVILRPSIEAVFMTNLRLRQISLHTVMLPRFKEC